MKKVRRFGIGEWYGRAYAGLTGGFPVTLPEFEEGIRSKLAR